MEKKKEIWLLQGGQEEDAMWRLSSQWAQLNSAFRPSPPRPRTADWSHFEPSRPSQMTTKSHCVISVNALCDISKKLTISPELYSPQSLYVEILLPPSTSECDCIWT